MNKLTALMEKGSVIFLQFVVFAVGVGSLIFMLWEPHLEGRNVNATLSQIYFNDPFLAWAYTASIAFFTGLYQIFRLVGYVGHGETGERPIKALKTIRYCALTLIGFLVIALAYLSIFTRGKDDIAGGVAMGLMLTLIFAVSYAAATVFENFLRKKMA